MKLIDRCGALSGFASVLLLVIGNDVMGQPPGPQSSHPTGEQDLENLSWLAGSAVAQAGIAVELVGFALFVVFVGYLTWRVREAGWLATTALVGGVTFVAIKLGSAAPMFAAYMLRDEISPQSARALVDMNGAAFVVSWLPTGIFVAFAAAAAMHVGVLGRVLGWGGVAVGTATVVAVAATGVNVLSAVFVPYLLGGLWILLTSLWLGLHRTATEAPPVPTHATPVAA